jgi:hypothetical protein
MEDASYEGLHYSYLTVSCCPSPAAILLAIILADMECRMRTSIAPFVFVVLIKNCPGLKSIFGRSDAHVVCRDSGSGIWGSIMLVPDGLHL